MTQYLNNDLFQYVKFDYSNIMNNIDKYMPWLKGLEDYNNYQYKIATSSFEQEINIIDRDRLLNEYVTNPLICDICTEVDGEYVINESVLKHTVPLYFEGNEYPNIRVWYELGEIIEYKTSVVGDKPFVCGPFDYSLRLGNWFCYLGSTFKTTKYYTKSDVIVKSMLHAINRDDLSYVLDKDNLKTLCVNPYRPICNEIYIGTRNEKYDFIKNMILCPGVKLDTDFYDKYHIMEHSERDFSNLKITNISKTGIKEYLLLSIDYLKTPINSYRTKINEVIADIYNDIDDLEYIKEYNCSTVEDLRMLYDELKKILEPPMITQQTLIGNINRVLDNLVEAINPLFVIYILNKYISKIMKFMPSIMVRAILEIM